MGEIRIAGLEYIFDSFNSKDRQETEMATTTEGENVMLIKRTNALEQ